MLMIYDKCSMLRVHMQTRPGYVTCSDYILSWYHEKTLRIHVLYIYIYHLAVSKFLVQQGMSFFR